MKDKNGSVNIKYFILNKFDYEKYKNKINQVLYDIIQNEFINSKNNINSIKLILEDQFDNSNTISNIQNFISTDRKIFSSKMKRAFYINFLLPMKLMD